MKKGRVNYKQLDFKFKTGNNKEYKVNGIQDSIIYVRESAK